VKHSAIWLVAGLLASCSSNEMSSPEGGGGDGVAGGGGSAGSGGFTPGPTFDDSGVEVSLTLRSAALDQLASEVTQARAQTSEELLAARAVPFLSSLSYDPLLADGLERIQASALGMNDAELARYAENGFVILPRLRYSSIPLGYFDVYAADLPVFVSADMVLEAVHRSFDLILKAVEIELLVPRLTRLLASMRARLAAGSVDLSQGAAEDADLFLGVAQSLLEGRALAPVTSLAPERLRALYDQAVKAQGEEPVALFGAERRIDFSQFEPRGHYEDDEALRRYFRAMIWIGRTDFRLLETESDGRRVLRRRQIEAALALRALMDDGALADWHAVDRGIGAFAGEHDYMVVPELDQLLADIGSTPEAGLGSVSDDVLAQAIVAGQYGEQRILSQIVIRDLVATGPLPLDASFALMGQRYTVDSHVFSNVVYDKVATRVLPDPLDAAFAALANDQAVSLLREELEQHSYAGQLASMRTTIDALPAEYWQSSLYTSWMAALRTLSPGTSGVASGAEGLPAVARTEAWGRRLLSTQLASWAELRHDTILYAKQSYTASSTCEFPDAYVEPYPEFFWSIARYAELGRAMTADIGVAAANPTLAAAMSSYFEQTARIATLLGEMAEAQRTGMPHTPEQIAFINQAIRIEGGGSGPPMHTGWYKDLYFDPIAALDFDPTVADVHTDPGGEIPPRGSSVLHVATGYPRPIVVSVDTCVGPRAYAGVVNSFHEHVAPGLERLTDSEWQEQLYQRDPDEVPWLAPVLGSPRAAR
jgi:uncharacterized protein DUF3160